MSRRPAPNPALRSPRRRNALAPWLFAAALLLFYGLPWLAGLGAPEGLQTVRTYALTDDEAAGLRRVVMQVPEQMDFDVKIGGSSPFDVKLGAHSGVSFETNEPPHTPPRFAWQREGDTLFIRLAPAPAAEGDERADDARERQPPRLNELKLPASVQEIVAPSMTVRTVDGLSLPRLHLQGQRLWVNVAVQVLTLSTPAPLRPAGGAASGTIPGALRGDLPAHADMSISVSELHGRELHIHAAAGRVKLGKLHEVGQITLHAPGGLALELGEVALLSRLRWQPLADDARAPLSWPDVSSDPPPDIPSDSLPDGRPDSPASAVQAPASVPASSLSPSSAP